MAEIWHINIRHWIDENEEPGTPNLKKKVQHLKEVISYETAKGTPFAFEAPNCWCKPKRKPCLGKIETIMYPSTLLPGTHCIQWGCAVCGDVGHLTGWEGLTCDLTEETIEALTRELLDKPPVNNNERH